MRVKFAIGALLLLAAVPAYADEPAAPAEQIAQAAPAAPPPPLVWGYNWSGLYVGISGGYGRGSSRQTDTTGTTTGDYSQTGGLVGGNVGYNWQFENNVVLGAEVDMSWAHLDGTFTSASLCSLTGGNTCFTKQSWLNTDRLKLGYAWDWLMVYTTGGLAIGDVQAGQNPCNVGITSCGTNTRFGWTVGGGAEAMVAPHWSVKLEGLHVDLGTKTQYVAAIPVRASEADNIIRVGLTYHFNEPEAAAPVMPAMAPAPVPVGRRVFLVFFDWDRDNITNGGMQVIEKAADAYRSGAQVRLMVTGYTDRSGSQGYNQRLSERRAHNVAKALQGMGVPREQMDVSGRGENDNRVPTANGVREPQNRRVEIGVP